MATNPSLSLGSIVKDRSKSITGSGLASDPNDVAPRIPAMTTMGPPPPPAPWAPTPGPSSGVTRDGGTGVAPPGSSLADITRPGDISPLPAGTNQNGTTNGIIGSQITAKTGTVSGDMLAQEQLRRITDENGPLMQQAAARAAQTANSRGLMNSSLAAQGGQEAVISAATPLALQDANTYFTNQRDNLAAENQFGLADKSSQLQDVLQGRDLSNRYIIAKEGNAAQVQSANIGAGAQVSAAYIRAQVDREQMAQNGAQFAATMGYNRDQAAIDRSWRSGESAAERDARIKEAENARRFTSDQAAIDRSWRSGESAAERDARIKEAENARDFNRTENQLTRSNQTTLQQMTIDANTRANAASLSNSTFQSWSSGRLQIDTNSNMTAEDKEAARQRWDALYFANPNFPIQPAKGAYPTTPAPPPAPAPAPGINPATGKPYTESGFYTMPARK